MVLGHEDEASAQQWVDDWYSGVEQQAARVQAMGDRLSQLSVTVRSRDQMVLVRLNSTGVVTDLRLDERTRDQPASQTAEQVMAVMGTARSQLVREVSRVVEEAMGAGSASSQALISSVAEQLGVVTGGGRD